MGVGSWGAEDRIDGRFRAEFCFALVHVLKMCVCGVASTTRLASDCRSVPWSVHPRFVPDTLASMSLCAVPIAHGDTPGLAAAPYRCTLCRCVYSLLRFKASCKN